MEISSSDDNSTDSSDITSEDSELFDEEKQPKFRRRRKYRRKYTRHDHWSKKKRFERSQKVSHEYIGENLKIHNSREKQTVTVNQSTIANTRGLMKYSTLDGAIPKMTFCHNCCEDIFLGNISPGPITPPNDHP